MTIYSKKDCVKALRKARDKTGRSPTIQEYNSLDISPSSDTIIKNFGSWNKAKIEADLETNQQNNQIQEKPEDIDLPKGKKWRSLSPYQRYYYKNREKEKQRTKERTEKLKNWFKEYKKTLQCESCDEDHPACLDFHHEAEKEAGVTQLVSQRNTSKDRIKQEIDKCTVLCANCHRKLHSEH